jgi:hypothetical protein
MPEKWKRCIDKIIGKQSDLCISTKFKSPGCYNPYALCSKLRSKEYIKKEKKAIISKEPFILYKSDLSSKKWSVYVPTENGRVKKVSYGCFGMSDYTLHKDKIRRERYRNRHRNDHINDPYKPGFWSWWHLWGESSNSKTAFKDAVRRANKII